jgi:hypothetical protein
MFTVSEATFGIDKSFTKSFIILWPFLLTQVLVAFIDFGCSTEKAILKKVVKNITL